MYATDGYSQSVQNMAQSSLETDMVFSDGYSLQLATVTGNVTDGMTATLNIPDSPTPTLRGRRDPVVPATKFGNQRRADGARPQRSAHGRSCSSLPGRGPGPRPG